MSDLYAAALREALTEAKAIRKEIDRLLARREAIKRLVMQLEPLVYVDRPGVKSIPRVEELTPALEVSEEPPEFLWQQIASVMRGVPEWSLSEAGAQVEQSFKIDLGNLRPQKVRNSVVRHLETFESVGNGKWRVK